MGFFSTRARDKTKLPRLEVIHASECLICPLNLIQSNLNPHMEPTGSEEPDVYIIGEAPGKEEDAENEQFIGKAGRLLRGKIPGEWEDRIRWNNTVRTRPIDNATPQKLEIEACRPSIIRDIVKSKPKAIFAMGTVPMQWGIPTKIGIGEWRGRRIPVNIGGHHCWFYAFHHPSYLARIKRGSDKPKHIGSEEERAFVFDLNKAFKEVESLPPAIVHTEKDVRSNTEIITGAPGDFARLKKLLEWAAKQELVGLDYETTCLRPYDANARILTAAIGTAKKSFAFVIHHKQRGWSPEELKFVEGLWETFLASQDTAKAVHNLAFELEWTGVKYAKELLHGSRWHDTMAQAAVLDERRGPKEKRIKGGPLSLEFLVQQYFGFNLKAMADLDKAKLDEEPLEDVLWYNAADAKYHCLLYEAQLARLEEDNLIEQYESALERIPTCVLTQIRGVPTNTAETALQSKNNLIQINESLTKLALLPEIRQYQERFGTPFKPESSRDCVMMFRDLLKRPEGWIEPPPNSDEKPRYSTDKDILEQINLPIAKLLIPLREARKRESTYIYRQLWPDGLLHATFNTLFAETGRLTSEGPNLQNIPKRDTEGREVRKQIEARLGHIILAADYGQIEARVIAMLSKDKAFVKALWERFDVHAYWADRIAAAYPRRIGGKRHLNDWKLGKQSKMKTFRTDIKNQWTFPLFFGAQLESVSGYLDIPVEKLRPEYQAFQNMFPGVFEWQEDLVKFYHEHGYVETPCGRRRRAPLSLNQIINSPVQGGAAEIVLDGMVRLSRHAHKTGDWNYQPNINIHDELVFMVPVKEVDFYAEKIVTEMVRTEQFDFINVPITIEMSMGENFLEMDETLVASSDDWKH